MDRVLTTCFATIVLIIVSSCNFSPEIEKSDIDLKLSDSFSSSGSEKLPEKWWEVFKDKQLNELIAKALVGNYDILTLWDKLDQAKATAEKAGAAFLPTVNASIDGAIKIPEPAVNQHNNFALSFSTSYEIDLWGRLNTARKASEFDFLASNEDVKTTAITVSTELAKNWFELILMKLRIKLLEAQELQNTNYLKLVNLNVEHGQSSISDKYQQEQLIISKKGEITLAKMSIALLEHSIAFLLGLQVDKFESLVEKNDFASQLPEIPLLPETGIPSELLERRPDVHAAFLRIKAANQRVGEAIANRFPKLSIRATYSGDGDSFKSLFSDWLLNLGANLLGPIFDGGKLSSEQERTEAAASEKVHAYLKTVLQALKEVEDSLQREVFQREYLLKVIEQIELSRKSLEIIWGNYLNGASQYDSVFNAVQSLQNLEIKGLEAKFNLLVYRINLYKALAGGWEIKRPD